MVADVHKLWYYIYRKEVKSYEKESYMEKFKEGTY